MWPEVQQPTSPLGFGSAYQGNALTANNFMNLGQQAPTFNLPQSQPNLVGAALQQAASGGSAAAGSGAEDVPVPGSDSAGWFKGIGGLDGLAQIAKGIGSLGSMFAAFKGLNLAKDQFQFQKESYQTNLANQTQAYNTELSDKATARYQAAGMPNADAEAYIAKHRL